MAQHFLTPINLNGNELQNASFQKLATEPASPGAGVPYYNTTVNKAFYWNGTAWVDMSGGDLSNLNAAWLTSGTVPSARLSGAYAGITGLGTITSGTWNGSVIGAAYIDSAIARLAGPSFTGNGSIAGNWTVGGNLIVNGTTVTVNSTVTTLDDPVLTLGGDTAPTVDDNKDRGIEFRYYDTQARTGFMGYDDSTGKFTFLLAATNTSEVFSGTKATLDANIAGSDVVGAVATATNATQLGGVAAASYAQKSDTLFLGTTSLALNRVSGALALTGITSIDGSAAKWTNGRTITLTGDATGTSGAFDGSANLSFAVSISAATVTGKALTGLTAGTATAIGATDTILGALAKLQAQVDTKAAIGAGGGVADSVDNLNSANPLSFWTGTQAEYDAIGTKNANTVYLVDGSNKYAADVAGTTTSETITHNLGTRDVTVTVYRVTTPWDTVIVDVERTTVNTVTLRFGAAPGAGVLRVVVQA